MLLRLVYPRGACHDQARATESRRAGAVQGAVRQFHRWKVGRADRRQVFREHHADHRQAVLRDPALGQGRRRSRARRRARGEEGVGPHVARGAREHFEQDRRSHGAESRPARACGNVGQRQAAARNARGRRAARDRSLPLFRGLHPRAGRLDRRDRSRHRRVSVPRAARRRRPDHSMELPAADGGVEARAGARGRQLRRAETGRADAGRHSRLGGAHRRSVGAGRSTRARGAG